MITGSYMNEKIIYWMFIVALLFGVCICGCQTTGAGANRNILEHQAEIDRLESAVQQYDSAMRNAAVQLRSITIRAQSMEGTVDDVIKLIDEYQRAVEQLIRDYNKVRSKIEIQTEAHSNIYYYPDCSDYRNDYWIYTIRKRHKAATVAGHTAMTDFP